MTTFVLYSTTFGALLLGAVLTTSIGFPIVARRARADLAETLRVVEGVRLAREPLHPLVEEALPDDQGPPIGAEPVPAQVRDGVTGRAVGPRTSGNAAPTEVEPPPHTGGPAGSISWPLSWRLLWYPLLALCYLASLRTTGAESVDAAEPVAAQPAVEPWVDPLESYRDQPSTGALLTARLRAERAERGDHQTRGVRHDGWHHIGFALGSSGQVLTLNPGWRKDSGEIPVAYIGELVGVAT